MSLYSDFITLLRQDTNDFGQRRYETADGDGTTTVFNLQNPKVLEGSYTVKVSNVLKTETTAYIMYPDIGQVVFNTGFAPVAGNDVVEFQYQSVNLTDANWVDIINQVLSNLRKKLWIEVLDSTTLTSVTDQTEYDLATVKTNNGGFSDIIWLLDFEYQLATNSPLSPTANSLVSNPWRNVTTVTNVRYFKDLQKIHIRPAFNTSGFPLRVRIARAYIQGTSSASTFEVQARYWPVIRKFCQAEYYSRMIPLAFKETSALSKEKTFENIKTLRDLANDLRKEAEADLVRVRMTKPGKTIAAVLYGMNL